MTLDYFESAKNAKEKLATISPTMCMAKWLQVSIHLHNGRTHSCYHPPAHKIPLSELAVTNKALHNTHEKIKERKEMWEGKRPSGCDYCWKIEDAPDGPHLSDRHYRSGEWWVKDAWDEVVSGEWDENINPRYVEVNFNQACNFKCTYCSPHLSSTWEQEIKELGPIPLLNGQETWNNIDILRKQGLMPIPGPNKNNPYVKAFWEWWPDLYKDLKVFRMTGGEPLMDKNTFKVFKYINENPNPNLELSITSNICPPQQPLFHKFVDYISKLEAPIDSKTFNDWKSKGFIKELTYYAKADGSDDWQKWPRFVVLDKNTIDDDTIDPDIPRIYRNKITANLDSNGRDSKTGDFTYSLIWFKPVSEKSWNCIGSQEKNKEGNNGIYLDIPRIKNFMLFASVDSYKEQAEYIRSGLNWDQFEDNVHIFLNGTRNTEITFINTFTLLSIPKLKSFMQFILDLRKTYGYENQILASAPGAADGDKSIVNKQRQRIWFDVPYLLEPKWMSAQNIHNNPEIMDMIDDVITFMEDNVADENYSKTYHGFKDYEIAKMKRNRAWIKSAKIHLNDTELKLRKILFWEYFNEIDKRRDQNFIKIFPELSAWWNQCYKEYNKFNNKDKDKDKDTDTEYKGMI